MDLSCEQMTSFFARVHRMSLNLRALGTRMHLSFIVYPPRSQGFRLSPRPHTKALGTRLMIYLIIYSALGLPKL
jgi:hypothetical protein